MVRTFGVGAGLVGEALVVTAGFDFGDQLRAEGLRVLVFLGREFGEREVAAEGVGFHRSGEIPEGGEVCIGEMQGIEAQRFFVGQLEHFLLRAATSDDGLAGGIIGVAEASTGAFRRIDHALDDIFFEGADGELDGDFLYGGVWQDAFDGADGDVMGASGVERRDTNFADQDAGALRAQFEDVVNPFGGFVEGGLSDYVEGFEREGRGVFCGGGDGCGCED